MTTTTKTATSIFSQFVLIAFHYSFKVHSVALDHCTNHLQTDQSLNEKRIIAACNATLMKSKWQRSEKRKKIFFFIFEPCQWTDRKRLHFILVTWESISQLDTSLVIEIHHKPYAVECWASGNNDWCLHSDPKQWPNTNYKSSTQNLQMFSDELKFMKHTEERPKITNYLANGTNGTMSNNPYFMHCLNECFYRISQHRT